MWIRNTNSEAFTLELVTVVNNFSNVFSSDLPSVPPKRKIGFGMDLLLNTQPIFIPPYRMASTKFKNLKDQLKV